MRWATALAALAATAALAACGSSASTTSTTSTTSSPSSAGSTTADSSSTSETGTVATTVTTVTKTAIATPTTTSSTSSSTTTVAATPPCAASELQVEAASLGAAAGHEGLVLLFKNIAPGACTLTGYPGVAGLDSAGNQVTQAQRMLSAYMGGYQGSSPTPPTVTLATGETASATVQGSDVTVGNETTCPTLAAMLVTPPNTSTSVRLPQAPPDCSGLIVTPVVPGMSGSTS